MSNESEVKYWTIPDDAAADILPGIGKEIAQVMPLYGFLRVEHVRAASDAQLLAVPGIGLATVKKWRKLLAEEHGAKADAAPGSDTPELSPVVVAEKAPNTPPPPPNVPPGVLSSLQKHPAPSEPVQDAAEEGN